MCFSFLSEVVALDSIGSSSKIDSIGVASCEVWFVQGTQNSQICMATTTINVVVCCLVHVDPSL